MSGELELEGEMDDLEGEADISEWATLISETEDKKAKKPHRSSRNYGSREGLERGRSSTTRQSNYRSRGSYRDSYSRYPKKWTPKKESEQTKNKTQSNVGDIAGVIESLDSSRKNTADTSKTHEDKKSDSDARKTKSDANVPSKGLDLSGTPTRKRKLSSNGDTKSSSSKKTYAERDSKDETSKDREDIMEETVSQKVDENEAEVFQSCSEEDSKNIDTELVEEMMDDVKKDMRPKYGDTYTVRFSPVELADLANETVQKLVMSQPNLVFYLKRQGKHKKKKGYAEVYLSQIQEARLFIQKLLQIKLVEHHVEITVTVSKPKKEDEVLSLKVWLDKNDKLLKLIKSSEDSTKVSPSAKKEHFQLEKVPIAANALMLRTLFPFAAEVIFSAKQKTFDSAYRGPVSVYYTSNLWLEAMLDCCSDFYYNGFSLSIQHTIKKEEAMIKPAAEVKKETGAVPERRGSVQDKTGSKTVKGSNNSSGSQKSDVNTKQDSSFDEDISNMTLDVCTGMLESLNKLRQLGTDNPNIIKILQMQNELATLQQSLSQSKEQSENSPATSHSDPWTVSATEDVADQQNDSEEADKKVSKEQKKKQKESKAEKQKKEMENLQKMIEEADEAKRQREEKAKRQLEVEMQKIKEQEEKRKSSWARKMIEDAKTTPHAGGESSSSKEEVQRILKLIESKRKDAEEAKKLEEEAKVKGMQLKVEINAETSISTGQSTLSAQTVSDGVKKKSTDDGGSFGVKLEKSEVVLEQDINTELPWSPDRKLHEGAPIYSEQEFNKMCAENAGDIIPWNHFVQITYYSNRRCPVQMCPSTKFFKTESSFSLHWENFHKPNVTVKFCQKCNAYFMNAPELEAHLVNRHSISDLKVVKAMTEEAREKVVSNPSFRDPGKFLPPLV